MFLDTGIYAGRDGIVQAVAANKASNTLITTFVPKFKKDGRRATNIRQEYTRVIKFTNLEIPTSKDQPGNYTYKTSDLSSHKTFSVDLNHTSLQKSLCDRDFCCNFDLEYNFTEKVVLPNSLYYRYGYIWEVLKELLTIFTVTVGIVW